MKTEKEDIASYHIPVYNGGTTIGVRKGEYKSNPEIYVASSSFGMMSSEMVIAGNGDDKGSHYDGIKSKDLRAIAAMFLKAALALETTEKKEK